MEHVYRFDQDPYNTHMLLMREVPVGARVLEIGTASGYLGDYLIREKKCEVWGVEPVEELWKEAGSVAYTKLLLGTVEEAIAKGELIGQKFDVILLGDVLEHMMNPGEVLRQLADFLGPDGRVVISLPNIAHYTTRWSLLRGHWDMTDSGILDRTHVRFFTRTTAVAMIETAGLEVVTARPSAGYIERFGLNKLWRIGQRCLRWWPELLAVQFIFTARVKR